MTRQRLTHGVFKGIADLQAAINLIQGVEALVFACPQVQIAFTGAFSTGDTPSYVHAQSFNINRDQLTAESRAAGRSAFRAQLGLTCDDRMGRVGWKRSALSGGYDAYVSKLIDVLLGSASSKVA